MSSSVPIPFSAPLKSSIPSSLGAAILLVALMTSCTSAPEAPHCCRVEDPPPIGRRFHSHLHKYVRLDVEWLGSIVPRGVEGRVVAGRWFSLEQGRITLVARRGRVTCEQWFDTEGMRSAGLDKILAVPEQALNGGMGRPLGPMLKGVLDLSSGRRLLRLANDVLFNNPPPTWGRIADWPGSPGVLGSACCVTVSFGPEPERWSVWLAPDDADLQVFLREARKLALPQLAAHQAYCQLVLKAQAQGLPLEEGWIADAHSTEILPLSELQGRVDWLERQLSPG